MEGVLVSAKRAGSTMTMKKSAKHVTGRDGRHARRYPLEPPWTSTVFSAIIATG